MVATTFYTCYPAVPTYYGDVYTAYVAVALLWWSQSYKKASQTAGLEPARAEPSGFLVHPLNRLGTTAHMMEIVPPPGIEPGTFRSSV